MPPSKGFMETARECKHSKNIRSEMLCTYPFFVFAAIDNWRVQADIADRRAHDEKVFREAGLAKPPRTYKFDPTRPMIRSKPKL